MKADMLIKNGRVVDPVRNFDGRADIAVKDGRIAAVPAGETVLANCELDAAGVLVLPGLIDYHVHVFSCCCDFAINPSLLAATGVTTAVDPGTAGAANFEAFEAFAKFQAVRLRYLLNVSSGGLPTLKYCENVDPAAWDRERIAKVIREHKLCAGLKVRQSRNIVGALGLTPLKEAVKLASELKTRCVVHVTDPPCSMGKLADELRPGDVFCHLYHGQGQTMLDERGNVLPELREARKRGVIFDAANGRNHFRFEIAEAALAHGFAPDIISTDATVLSFNKSCAFSLPNLMSKYLVLGMDMMSVARSVTETPAKLIGLAGKIGTLTPGAAADITVLAEKPAKIIYDDIYGGRRESGSTLVPQLTVKDGQILFRAQDFSRV